MISITKEVFVITSHPVCNRNAYLLFLRNENNPDQHPTHDISIIRLPAFSQFYREYRFWPGPKAYRQPFGLNTREPGYILP
ncbi:MAG: hypothetical protein KDD06_29890, partial [Phaeodactylibacter sp.]|nr:hypothetical protein [Phaeodactylibacter sp.]